MKKTCSKTHTVIQSNEKPSKKIKGAKSALLLGLACLGISLANAQYIDFNKSIKKTEEHIVTAYDQKSTFYTNQYFTFKVDCNKGLELQVNILTEGKNTFEFSSFEECKGILKVLQHVAPRNRALLKLEKEIGFTSKRRVVSAKLIDPQVRKYQIDVSGFYKKHPTSENFLYSTKKQS